MPLPTFSTISLFRSDIHPHVAVLELNRPRSRNALDDATFRELPEALDALARDGLARAVVLRGAGPAFCAGADLATLARARALVSSDTSETNNACPARQRLALRELIGAWQRALSALELCPLPSVAAIHGPCVGAGVDLVCAADLRLASGGATFCVKEVDLAIAADLGTLQRLPHLVGGAVARDWCLTGRVVGCEEAREVGFVSQWKGGKKRGGTASDGGGDSDSDSKESLFAAAEELAASLASKSPLALQGVKNALRKARDAPDVFAGLEEIATWNAAFLASEDADEAWRASAERRAPRFRSRL